MDLTYFETEPIIFRHTRSIPSDFILDRTIDGHERSMEPATHGTLEQIDWESERAPISNRSEKLGPGEERIAPVFSGVIQDRSLANLVKAPNSHPANTYHC